nr:hypothetical protein [Deltaproteobacteria bacterium]
MGRRAQLPPRRLRRRPRLDHRRDAPPVTLPARALHVHPHRGAVPGVHRAPRRGALPPRRRARPGARRPPAARGPRRRRGALRHRRPRGAQPLAIILNAVASLRRPIPTRERDLLLGILEEEADRINRIVTDLLTLARPLHPEAREILPKELIIRCLGPAERAGTEVELRSSPEAETPIQCDAHLLRHALENVIENAVQAMGTGGALTITLTRKTRQGVAGREIAVIDTGEGMNTEVRNSARKAFFTTRTTGTGLGLAIVDRILTAHRGAVDIESSRGEGTTVRLFVPEPPTAAPAPQA